MFVGLFNFKHQDYQMIRRNKYFDPLMGSIGGVFMGTLIYTINASHGFNLSIVAALKQGSYTFIMGGITMKLVENLVRKIDERTRAILIAVTLPTLFATMLTYILHSIKGTPEPIFSTLPTLLLSPFSFFWWANKQRKKFERSTNN